MSLYNKILPRSPRVVLEDDRRLRELERRYGQTNTLGDAEAYAAELSRRGRHDAAERVELGHHAKILRSHVHHAWRMQAKRVKFEKRLRQSIEAGGGDPYKAYQRRGYYHGAGVPRISQRAERELKNVASNLRQAAEKYGGHEAVSRAIRPEDHKTRRDHLLTLAAAHGLHDVLPHNPHEESPPGRGIEVTTFAAKPGRPNRPSREEVLRRTANFMRGAISHHEGASTHYESGGPSYEDQHHVTISFRREWGPPWADETPVYRFPPGHEPPGGRSESRAPRTLTVLEGLYGPAIYKRLLEAEPEQLDQRQTGPEQDVTPLDDPLATHDIPHAVKRVARHIAKAGGRAYLAGGPIRDKYVGKQPKDFDFEVYGLEPDHLKQHLGDLGKVSDVGESFKVLNLRYGGHDFDVAVPRRERKTGEGHKGFEVTADPHMPMSDATRRRDFTVNSMLMDPLTGHVYDPHGGSQDLLHSKTLKHVDERAFAEDPLRVLRGAQFGARLGLTVHPDTLKLMQGVQQRLGELPNERIGVEWQKLLMKGQHPSHGLEILHQAGVLGALHPEIHQLTGDPDQWSRTKRAADHAVRLTADMRPVSQAAVRYAALLHGVDPQAIPNIIAQQMPPKGQKGEQQRLPTVLSRKVPQLVSALPEVQKIYDRRFKSPDADIRRLAHRLSPRPGPNPATIEELVRVAHAHHGGTSDDDSFEFPAGKWLLHKAKALGVDKGGVSPLLSGADLIQHLKLKPGPQFQPILSAVFEKQLDGKVNTPEEALQAAQDIVNQQQQPQQQQPMEAASLYARLFPR